MIDRERLINAWDTPPFREFFPRFGAKQLQPLEEGCTRVQWREPLSDPEYVRIAEFLKDYPEMPVHICMHSVRRDGPLDLSFLRHFKGHGHFSVDVKTLADISQLPLLGPGLSSLKIGATTSKTLDLSVLAAFPDLRVLHLTGHSKNIVTLSKLTSLEELMLRSVKLSDLSLLLPLRGLRSLDIKLGGMRDISLLPEFKALQYLEIWRTRGLRELSAIGATTSLEHVFLQAMNKIESVPDLSKLTKLHTFRLMTMRGIRDLAPIAAAPALEVFHIHDCASLVAEDFRPFVGHPALRTLLAALSEEVEAVVFAMLGLAAPKSD